MEVDLSVIIGRKRIEDTINRIQNAQAQACASGRCGCDKFDTKEHHEMNLKRAREMGLEIIEAEPK